MKNTLSILAIFAFLTIYTIYSGDVSQEQSNKAFEDWKLKYNNRYEAHEEIYRLGVYLSNQKHIAEHNSNPAHTYQLGENQFMAQTKEEFIGLYLQASKESVPNHSIGLNANPVDWRGITKVKDQKTCASGWAFSSIGAVEAYFQIRKGQSVDLSEQQLIDCEVYSQGCSEGNNIFSFGYVYGIGISSQSEYPYVAQQQRCYKVGGEYRTDGTKEVGGSVQTLQDALQNGPVSVSVDASNWQFYKSGIFANCSQTSFNHYALADGYDDNGNWYIKNSWGFNWGIQGYIRLAAGNTCAITASAYQPI